MILFNTTFHLDSTIETDFLEWLRDHFIPKALSVGLTQPLLCRLIENVEPGCSAFALQFVGNSISEVESWRSVGLSALISEMTEQWKGRALAFSTPMMVLDL